MSKSVAKKSVGREFIFMGGFRAGNWPLLMGHFVLPAQTAFADTFDEAIEVSQCIAGRNLGRNADEGLRGVEFGAVRTT